MFRTAAVPKTFVACADLAGASTSKAKQLTTPTRRLPIRNTLSGFSSAAAMALGLATFVPANSALAATFANTDGATITMTGKIDLDDEQKFGDALRYAPNFRKLVVNSPGGSIVPAILIGKGLRTGSYEVQVADNGECASACTLLLAAAAERSAYSSSLIAVHSASRSEPDGTRKPETDHDLAFTARLARYMKEWGTPAVIIGKMIGTPGNKATPRPTATFKDGMSGSSRPLRRSRRRSTPHANVPRAAELRSAGRRAHKGPAHLRLRAVL
jgi:hypothetical protein